MNEQSEFYLLLSFLHNNDGLTDRASAFNTAFVLPQVRSLLSSSVSEVVIRMEALLFCF